MRGRLLVVLAAVLLLPSVLAAPEQVHVGLPTSDPSTARSVLWLEGAPREGAQVTLDTPDGPKAFPADIVPGPSAGVAFEAKLTGLQPGATYAYHVLDRTFAFRTPPAAQGEFTFAAFGDMGADAHAAATVKAVQEASPDFVLLSGDISYAGGNPAEWKAWFDLVEPSAATIPWITALGNHEADVAGAQVPDEVPPPVGGAAVVSPTEQAFYKQRFGLPGNELYYSFDWRGAHFVALDTFSQPTIPPEEAAWLEQDLAAHQDATWRVVFLHEPPYSSNAAHGSSARVQQAFVPIFEKGHVDLVIAAHDHSYERFAPLSGGKPAAPGSTTYDRGVAPLYVVSGGGGAGLYKSWRSPLIPGSVAHDASHHILLFRVTPERLEGRYVSTEGGSFSDAFTIASAAPRPGDVPAAVQGRATEATGLLAGLAGIALLAMLRGRTGRR